jgi:integrase
MSRKHDIKNSAMKRQNEAREHNNPGFGEDTIAKGLKYEQITEEDVEVVRDNFDERKSLQDISIRRIKHPRMDPKRESVGEPLTVAEVLAMIDACKNTSERSFIYTLYEGALRCREIQTLTWGQVEFDKYGVNIRLNNMTGRPREVRLVAALLDLSAWRDDYPLGPEGDNPVFITRHNKPLEQKNVMNLLRKIAKRAGITKPVTPHLLRHSRMTHLIQQGCNESITNNDVAKEPRRSGSPGRTGKSPAITPMTESYKGRISVTRSETRPMR